MTNPIVFDSLNTQTITHGFFTRTGGVSAGLYSELNGGIGSKDDPSNVAENRRIIAGILAERRITPLLSCYQIHSNVCVTVTSPWEDSERPEADAMVTKKPGIILGILTADCAPVLFADHKNNVIGAAHAGWQGAVKGVVSNTVKAMEALGAEREHIVTAVGPCIQQASYEVTSAFKHTAINTNPHAEKHFLAGKDADHFQFDLFGFVHADILNCGLKPAISEKTPYDTYQDESLFYSFRRATHKKEPDYGRQVSAIMLKS